MTTKLAHFQLSKFISSFDKWVSLCDAIAVVRATYVSKLPTLTLQFLVHAIEIEVSTIHIVLVNCMMQKWPSTDYYIKGWHKLADTERLYIKNFVALIKKQPRLRYANIKLVF